MVSLNVQTIYLFISYSIIFANVHSVTTTTSTLESEVNDVITEFIGKDIKNNETLFNKVHKAIEHVSLQKKYQELELRHKEDAISRKNFQLFNNVYGIKKKLKTHFRALCIYKAASLIDSIEEKLQPRDPEFCRRCLDWGHEKTNCTNEKQQFGGVDKYDKERVYTQGKHWYWMLEHLRDDVNIGRLSDYLEQVYYKTNFTTLYNLTADQSPANYGKFKLIFCFALGEIKQRPNYLVSRFRINDAYLRDIKIGKISIDKFVEIFLKALGKWVDFEESSLLDCDDDSIAETTTMSPLEPEIDNVVNVFIGEDISGNETLLQEVKNAIQHVLLKKRNLQLHVLMKNEIIRRKTKRIEGNYLDLYETKLRTFIKALYIHEVLKNSKIRNINVYPDEKPPLCSNCLDWNHTADNCNSSKATFGGNVSISKDVYSWYWMLHYHSDSYSSQIERLSKNLQKAYDSGNYTNTFEPKPENFRQFKYICCEALAKIYHYVNYLSTSYDYESQMKDINIYGIPLFQHVLFLFRQIGYSELSDKLA